MPAERQPQAVGRPGQLAEHASLHVEVVDQLLQRSQQAALRAADRATQTRHRVGLMSRRVQRTADTAHELLQAAAVVDRFVEIKQRELAAHLAAVNLHKQAAELQDRLGWPDRAAVAWVRAARHRTGRPT
jgi:hypothetical protein